MGRCRYTSLFDLIGGQLKDKKQDALRKRKFRKEHPEKHREDQKKYYDRNKAKVISRRRSQRTFWTPEEFDSALETQKRRCAICNKKFGKRNKPCADHDHKKKKPRGLLCFHCNWMLGHAKDSPRILSIGARYLLKHQPSSRR